MSFSPSMCYQFCKKLLNPASRRPLCHLTRWRSRPVLPGQADGCGRVVRRLLLQATSARISRASPSFLHWSRAGDISPPKPHQLTLMELTGVRHRGEYQWTKEEHSRVNRGCEAPGPCAVEEGGSGDKDLEPLAEKAGANLELPMMGRRWRGIPPTRLRACKGARPPLHNYCFCHRGLHLHACRRMILALHPFARCQPP
jgi:hypothetical protein